MATATLELQVRAQEALHKSSNYFLRRIEVVQEDDGLHLKGRVPSYYDKQQAQEAVRAKCETSTALVNEVVVE